MTVGIIAKEEKTLITKNMIDITVETENMTLVMKEMTAVYGRVQNNFGNKNSSKQDDRRYRGGSISNEIILSTDERTIVLRKDDIL